MYELKISDYCFIAHSLKDDFFGPAKHLHGTTYIIDMMLLSDKLINNNIIIDIIKHRKPVNLDIKVDNAKLVYP